jgi:hypothetical protein
LLGSLQLLATLFEHFAGVRRVTFSNIQQVTFGLLHRREQSPRRTIFTDQLAITRPARQVVLVSAIDVGNECLEPQMEIELQHGLQQFIHSVSYLGVAMATGGQKGILRRRADGEQLARRATPEGIRLRAQLLDQRGDPRIARLPCVRGGALVGPCQAAPTAAQ